MLNRRLVLLLLCVTSLSFTAKSTDLKAEALNSYISSSVAIVDAISLQITDESLRDFLEMLRVQQFSANIGMQKTAWRMQFENFYKSLSQLRLLWIEKLDGKALNDTLFRELNESSPYQAYLRFCALTKEVLDVAMADSKTIFNQMNVFTLKASPHSIAFVGFKDEHVIAVPFDNNNPGLTVSYQPNLFKQDELNFRRTVIVVLNGTPYNGSGTIVRKDDHKHIWNSAVFAGEASRNPFSTSVGPHVLSGFNGKQSFAEIGDELDACSECVGTSTAGQFFIMPYVY